METFERLWKDLKGEKFLENLRESKKFWRNLEEFETILIIPDGVFDRILKNLQELETIRKSRKNKKIKNLKERIRQKMKESESVWKNLEDFEGI